jgi:hypothetical protein
MQYRQFEVERKRQENSGSRDFMWVRALVTGIQHFFLVFLCALFDSVVLFRKPLDLIIKLRILTAETQSSQRVEFTLSPALDKIAYFF